MVKRSIGPIAFELLTTPEAVSMLVDTLGKRIPKVVAFVNMHTFNLATRLPDLNKALTHATVFNDGVGIDVASLILFGQKFPDNLNGTDLTPALLSSLIAPTKLFLVGSPPGVAELAGMALEAKFPLVEIVGVHHGYFNNDESGSLVQRICQSGAELILLGMGNPRQEIWAAEVVQETGGVILCVGAFLDFASGRVRRAPRLVRTLRVEWLYRLFLEPSRLTSRYVGGFFPFFRSILLERFK